MPLSLFPRLVVPVFCGLLPGAALAALEADVTTSRGVVTIELAYDKAPGTVANFITLAEGSRSWVEPFTGGVKAEPFYDELGFMKVENTPSSKLAETGSIAGSGTDGPGYAIRDEFNATLLHEAYVVAMSSEGPNTGGSRWYLSGNVARPSRNSRDVVFGKVNSPASRAVVDAIIDAGAANSSITGISFRRTDAAAQAFDETAVPLPSVSGAAGSLSVVPGTGVQFDFPQPASSVLRATTSIDLSYWMPQYRSFIALDDSLPAALRTIGPADAPKRFYNFSLASFPGAGGPSSFANRTLVTTTSHTGPMSYEFDETGLAGTFVNSPFPEFPELVFAGTFVVRTDVEAPVLEPYSFRVHIQTTGLPGDTPNHVIRGGYDAVLPTKITGRQFSDFYSAGMVLMFAEPDAGQPLELSRP